MFNKLVIATGNQGKLKEIRHLLEPLNIEIIPQSALNIPECEEPFCTFIENALAKARHASKHSGLPALAVDSGLCVDALQGAPGVLSARYAGEPGTLKVNQDARNNQKLLEVLGAEKNRHAHFYCVIVLVRHAHDPEPIIAEGQWAGKFCMNSAVRTGLVMIRCFWMQKPEKPWPSFLWKSKAVSAIAATPW